MKIFLTPALVIVMVISTFILAWAVKPSADGFPCQNVNKEGCVIGGAWIYEE